MPTQPTPEAAIDAKLRTFLEEWPLYRKLTLDIEGGVASLAYPKAISRPCPVAQCRKKPVTTWTLDGEIAAEPGTILRYKCAHCGLTPLFCWIHAGRTSEVGETLPPSTAGAYSGSGRVRTGRYGKWVVMK